MRSEDYYGSDVEEMFDPSVEEEEEAAKAKISDESDDDESFSTDVEMNENQ